MLQMQQVLLSVAQAKYACTYLSNYCILRFGHFARECREEEDRCYKCHGKFHGACILLYNCLSWLSMLHCEYFLEEEKLIGAGHIAMIYMPYIMVRHVAL